MDLHGCMHLQTIAVTYLVFRFDLKEKKRPNAMKLQARALLIDHPQLRVRAGRRGRGTRRGPSTAPRCRHRARLPHGRRHSPQGSQYRSKFRGISDISVLSAGSDIFFTGRN